MCRSCRPNGIFSNKKSFFIYAIVRSKRGKILSQGFNSYIKTSPLQSRYAKSVNLPKKEFIHAEISALSRIPYTQRKNAYSITIYRFDNHGRPALAKPCPICQAAIEHFGIKHVYYTTPDDDQDMDYNKYEDIKEQNRDCWGGEIYFDE